ncbi:MAG: aspartate aminotransferase family protein [Candidatus Dormibacteraeota bacterium]|nr:aspartate aminotransferase family protein [Candidatus Dormibacteraeota bacterium]
MSRVFYRDLRRSYPVIDHGEGIFLFDSTGKRYLDGASGALVANLGHGRREIAEAMAAQAQRVAFAHTSRFTSAPQEELAERVARLLPYGLCHLYPVSGGSEATETAVKLARQFHLESGQPARHKVLTAWSSYHGNSLGALAASGHLARRRPHLPLLSPAFEHFEPPRESCQDAPEGGSCPCLSALARAIERADPSSVAAIILEPVSGSAASGRVPHPGYLKGVRRLADEYGILLVADEVMTGFGRTGEIIGMVHSGVAPDLITCAKGLSGGYAPLGAVVCGERVYRAFAEGSGRFAHGFTYSGHPVACAAGARALKILEEEQLVDNARRMGEMLRSGLESLGDRHPIIRRVRGVGLMQGLVLEEGVRPGANAAALANAAFAEGLIVYPGSGGASSTTGDHLLVAPPLVIREGEVDQLLSLLDEALGRLAEIVSHAG